MHTHGQCCCKWYSRRREEDEKEKLLARDVEPDQITSASEGALRQQPDNLRQLRERRDVVRKVARIGFQSRVQVSVVTPDTHTHTHTHITTNVVAWFVVFVL